MKLPNNKLIGILKKTIDKRGNRPILQAIHFDKDGSLTATNSHVLLRLDNFHSIRQNFNLNLMSFAEEDDIYPETKNLIPKSFKYEVKVNPVKFVDILPLLKSMYKEQFVTVKSDLNKNNLTITGKYASLKLSSNKMVNNEVPMDITISPQYLAQALEFFNFFTNSDVTIGYNSSLLPLVFKADKATYLITPVRVYQQREADNDGR